MTKRRRRRTKKRIVKIIIGLIIIFGLYKIIQSFLSTDGFVDTVTGPVIGSVVLDAGHGGNDVGCINGSYYEKDITLEYVREIGNYLMKNGVQVYYTRKDDNRLANHQAEDLQLRCDLAYNKQANYFISVHVNASTNDNASGFEIYCNKSNIKSYALAENISNSMEKIGYSKNRGILDGNSLYVIKNNKVNAILIELGYIRSSDMNYLTSNRKTRKLSEKIAQGIIDTLNNK